MWGLGRPVVDRRVIIWRSCTPKMVKLKIGKESWSGRTFSPWYIWKQSILRNYKYLLFSLVPCPLNFFEELYRDYLATGQKTQPHFTPDSKQMMVLVSCSNNLRSNRLWNSKWVFISRFIEHTLISGTSTKIR